LLSSPVTPSALSLHLTPLARLALQEPAPLPSRQLAREGERRLLLALSTVSSGHLPPGYNRFSRLFSLGLAFGEQDYTRIHKFQFLFFSFIVNLAMNIHIGKFTLASPTIISSVTSTTMIVLSVACPMEHLGTEFISMQPTLATLTSLYGWFWVVTENFFAHFSVSIYLAHG